MRLAQKDDEFDLLKFVHMSCWASSMKRKVEMDFLCWESLKELKEVENEGNLKIVMKSLILIIQYQQVHLFLALK